MSFRKLIFSGVFLLVVCFKGQSQSTDSLSLEMQLAQLEKELDSLLVFNLIDSILSIQTSIPSELQFRVGYNTNVLNVGRNYGINQHGISPGVSFYHKTGVFADFSGFWGSAYDPKYNLSVASLGYIHLLGKNWTLSANYERWIYNYKSSNAANSVGATTSFTAKHFYQSLDYTYFFGSSNSHRFISTTSGNFKKKNFWIFNSITLYPSVSLVYGNQLITVKFSEAQKQTYEYREYLRENLDQEAFKLVLDMVNISSDDQRKIDFINRNPRLSEAERRVLITKIYLKYDEVQNYLSSLLYDTKYEYGFMNWSLSLPIVFRVKQFSFTTSYTYSIPIRLPKETGDLSPVGYFGLSISYRLPIR